jgi:hypothetical protein
MGAATPRRRGACPFNSIPSDDFDTVVDRDLDHVPQRRILKELIGYIEFGVELPLGASDRLWQVSGAKRIGDATCSAAAAHPLDIALQLFHFLPIAPIDQQHFYPKQDDSGEQRAGNDD